MLAAGALVGVPSVILLEGLASLVGDAHRRSVNFYTAYNSAVYVLSGVAGSSVLFGAARHGIGGFELLGIGALAGLIYYVVNVTRHGCDRARDEARSSLRYSGNRLRGSHHTT